MMYFPTEVQSNIKKEKEKKKQNRLKNKQSLNFNCFQNFTITCFLIGITNDTNNDVSESWYFYIK